MSSKQKLRIVSKEIISTNADNSSDDDEELIKKIFGPKSIDTLYLF